MDTRALLKELQTCVKAVKLLDSGKSGATSVLPVLEKAFDAARNLEGTLVAHLEQARAEAKSTLAAAIETRRENVLRLSHEAGLPCKRFGEYDRIGPLKVTYKGWKVRLELGSELLVELEAVKGEDLLASIRRELDLLERRPFSRDSFFKSVKLAYRMALDAGDARDGWAPLRNIWTYTTLTQQVLSSEFMKQPDGKHFRQYSSAQFVYDLARFGKEGWAFGEDILQSRTPNMATVAAGRAMTLPDLAEPEKLGPQIAVLRIERPGR